MAEDPAPDVHIAELIFLDGTRVSMPPNGITLIVGPNNAGKSVLLGEMSTLVGRGPHDQVGPLRTLTSITLDKNGSVADLVGWLEAHGVRGRRARDSPRAERMFYGSHQQVSESMLQQGWEFAEGLGQVASLLMSHQTTETRLQQVGGVGVHNLETDEPGHPLQKLWADKERERSFVALFRRAFGLDLCINRYVPSIDLKVGRPTRPLTAPPPSSELLAEYSSFRSVQEQGDGVRSFTGLLLHTVVPTTNRIIMIDEPEAFLHSPQARLLAQYLTEHAPAATQLVLATHSQDVVKGVITAAGDREVQIIRLTRGQIGPPGARVLAPELLAELSNDTFLQHSNVLGGLFHDGVILCEADTDCSYYDIVVASTFVDHRLPDLMFTQVAGKARVSGVTRKLRALGIPVVSIVDFDVLEETHVLRSIVDACGGDFVDIADDVLTVQASVEAPAGPTLTQVRLVLEQISQGLGPEDRLDSTRTQAVRDGLRAKSGWKHLKRTGLRGLEPGAAYEAAERVLERLAGMGVFVVPVGELESWHPQFPKNNAWLGHVLDSDQYRQPDTQRDKFIRSIVEYLAAASGRAIEPLSEELNPTADGSVAKSPSC